VPEPERLVVVTGTGTDVGKTWVGARLLRAVRDAGAAVAARKPVQSFEAGMLPRDTDAGILGAASGEDVTTVCVRSYPVAMAPPMAAEVLGQQPPTMDELVDSLTWPDPWPPGRPTVGLVEGAGGVRSPLAVDGDTVDLIRRLRTDVVVLVADAGLGTLNTIRLSAGVLPVSPVVVLNRLVPGDDLHERNRRWLADAGFDVVVSIEELVTRVLR
jgi:dethiobiotin synthetase